MAMPHKRRRVIGYLTFNGNDTINLYKCEECQCFFPTLKSIHEHFKPCIDGLNDLTCSNHSTIAEHVDGQAEKALQSVSVESIDSCSISHRETECTDEKQDFGEVISHEITYNSVENLKRKHEYLADQPNVVLYNNISETEQTNNIPSHYCVDEFDTKSDLLDPQRNEDVTGMKNTDDVFRHMNVQVGLSKETVSASDSVFYVKKEVSKKVCPTSRYNSPVNVEKTGYLGKETIQSKDMEEQNLTENFMLNLEQVNETEIDYTNVTEIKSDGSEYKETAWSLKNENIEENSTYIEGSNDKEVVHINRERSSINGFGNNLLEGQNDGSERTCSGITNASNSTIYIKCEETGKCIASIAMVSEEHDDSQSEKNSSNAKEERIKPKYGSTGYVRGNKIEGTLSQEDHAFNKRTAIKPSNNGNRYAYRKRVEHYYGEDNTEKDPDDTHKSEVSNSRIKNSTTNVNLKENSCNKNHQQTEPSLNYRSKKKNFGSTGSVIGKRNEILVREALAFNQRSNIKPSNKGNRYAFRKRVEHYYGEDNTEKDPDDTHDSEVSNSRIKNSNTNANMKENSCNKTHLGTELSLNYRCKKTKLEHTSHQSDSSSENFEEHNLQSDGSFDSIESCHNCDKCKIEFTSTDCYLNHMILYHVPTFTRTALTKCPVCEFSSDGYLNSKLKLHVTKIHALDEMNCLVCNLRFDKAIALQKHILVCNNGELKEASKRSETGLKVQCVKCKCFHVYKQSEYHEEDLIRDILKDLPSVSEVNLAKEKSDKVKKKSGREYTKFLCSKCEIRFEQLNCAVNHVVQFHLQETFVENPLVKYISKFFICGVCKKEHQVGFNRKNKKGILSHFMIQDDHTETESEKLDSSDKKFFAMIKDGLVKYFGLTSLTPNEVSLSCGKCNIVIEKFACSLNHLVKNHFDAVSRNIFFQSRFIQRGRKFKRCCCSIEHRFTTKRLLFLHYLSCAFDQTIDDVNISHQFCENSVKRNLSLKKLKEFIVLENDQLEEKDTHSLSNAKSMEEVSNDMVYRIVQSNGMFFCMLCHSRFNRISCCKNHVLTEHSGIFIYPKGTEVYTCLICDCHFHRIYLLNKHYETLHDTYKFKCLKCDKKFNHSKYDHLKFCKNSVKYNCNANLLCKDCGHVHNSIVYEGKEDQIKSYLSRNETIFRNIRIGQSKSSGVKGSQAIEKKSKVSSTDSPNNNAANIINSEKGNSSISYRNGGSNSNDGVYSSSNEAEVSTPNSGSFSSSEIEEMPKPDDKYIFSSDIGGKKPPDSKHPSPSTGGPIICDKDSSCSDIEPNPDENYYLFSNKEMPEQVDKDLSSDIGGLKADDKLYSVFDKGKMKPDGTEFMNSDIEERSNADFDELFNTDMIDKETLEQSEESNSEQEAIVCRNQDRTDSKGRDNRENTDDESLPNLELGNTTELADSFQRKSSEYGKDNSYDVAFDGKLFYCLVCLEKFEEFTCCYTHTLLEHNLRKSVFTCTVCLGTFCFRASYMSHMKKMHNLDCFYCAHCCVGFENLGMRAKHMNKCQNHGEELPGLSMRHVCKKCFTVHVNVSDDMRSSCKDCELGFASISCAKNHFFMKHFPSRVILSSVHTMFRCHCGKVALTKAELKSHFIIEHRSVEGTNIDDMDSNIVTSTESNETDYDHYFKALSDRKCVGCEHFHIIDSKDVRVIRREETKCKMCKKDFAANSCLQNHILKVHCKKYEWRQCVGCSLYVAGSEMLESHQKNKHIGTLQEEHKSARGDTDGVKCMRSGCLLTCDVCGEIHQHKFLMKESKIYDAKSPHDIREERMKSFQYKKAKWVCQFCDLEFENKNQLKEHTKCSHEKIEDNKGDFCQLCKKQIANDVYYSEHILQEHFSLKFVEGECLGNFWKSFSCLYCKETFAFCMDMQMHLRIKHFEKPLVARKHFNQTMAINGQSCLHCPLCLKHIKIHSKVHLDKHFTGIKANKAVCDICGMGFKSQHLFKNHRLGHTGIRAFKCNFCEKSFLRPHNLATHILVHKEKKEQCKECGMKFTLPHHLRAHMQRKHP